MAAIRSHHAAPGPERGRALALAQRRARRRGEPAPPGTRNLYVIRLDPAVALTRHFRRQNPGWDPATGRGCVYVGSTARSPRERFIQHLEGVRSSRSVRRFGQSLMWRQFAHRNPVPAGEAGLRAERDLAAALRRRGWGVLQA